MDQTQSKFQKVVGITIVVSVIGMSSACSTKTIERESSRETTASDRGRYESPDSHYEHSSYKEREVETEESHSSCSGVLSCAVNAVGEVIAFPFRAVGYVFQALF